MARRQIDIGSIGNDGTGDSIRDSFRKVNDNFRELYSSLGLGERLRFTGLDDTPDAYQGQNDPVTGSTPVVTIANDESGLVFKKLIPGNGISIDFTTNPNEIAINADFAEISADVTPQLGGNLSARSGGQQYRIVDLGTTAAPLQPLFRHEAVNKAYADTKISRAGVNSINPETGNIDSSFGRMSGPLILSRDPEPDDDDLYGGLVAATKRYVDNAAFGSSVNLYVALSGEDERPGVSKALQGRALAYAYRTIESALKRAEEIILEAPVEIGPYKKVLTFNNGAQECTLSEISASPLSGSGFVGSVRMSVDAVTLTSVGVNYYPGDILRILGGTVSAAGAECLIEVLTTLTTPGAISSFRIVSTGSYIALPGSTSIATTISSSAAPVEIGAIGAGAQFNITYKVNSVGIVNGGTGYSLVSVRVVGGGGAGAFGTAVVTGGSVSSITITDTGSRFISIPTLTVDLPRFLIRTDFLRTDFTGDVLTDTPQAIRSRDIREGLFLRGETSGALAQILSHTGALDSLGNELFDVDIKFGSFIINEPISYGDIAVNAQISILIESGEYYENYPLKVPQNVSIVGDEFRRVILRPRPGTSSSPWAFQKFRRDTVIDGLTVADRLYGYHYLQDSGEPVYPKINNKGDYDSAAALITNNREFIQEEIVAWMDNNIQTAAPATTWFNFNYDKALYRRDAGLLVDAFTFDLKYGGYNRTISAGLKYYESDSARITITTQLAQYRLVLAKLNQLMQSIILNIAVAPLFQTLYIQIIDPAFTSEVGSGPVITELINALEDVIDGSGSVNYPKENNEMDVFLANDTVRWQAISAQGHGGFMLVLDPTGQILAKSPYAQECASFSRSINRQTFAGGKFVDGFTGNLQFKHIATDITNTRLSVTGLDRIPNLPASFLVDDGVFRINYVRDFIFNSAGSTANFILDETTPFRRLPGAQICTISNGDPAVFTRIDHQLQAGSTIEFFVSPGGTLPSGVEIGVEYYVLSDGLTNNTFNITETFGSIVKVATTTSGSGTFSYQRLYELLMPGNRSMLSNDFTQINDLGYGLVAANGGLIEAVSMFTYYCHISYYSLSGGQIRSIGGSSAHGNYALVAEGADPLEVPTPTTVYEDFSQGAKCYFPTPSFANVLNGLFIFVYAYDYIPLGGSELEIDHAGTIFKYPVTSVSTGDLLPPGVARLNIGSAEGVTSDGLFAQVPNDTLLTIRKNGQLLLTGDLAEVSVRPSTGLKLRETDDSVYRVLEFSSYPDSNAPYQIAVTQADPAVFKILTTVITISTNLCTTLGNHKLRTGDKFIPTISANNFVAGTIYFVISVPEYNQFTVSTSLGGSATALVNGTGLYIQGAKTHKLLENYSLQLTAPLLDNVLITGTSGTFSCSRTSLILGQTITISGINLGSGSISGYASPTTYFIIATNNTTTFTLSTTANGVAVTTTAGTPIGLTFTGVFPTPLTLNDTIYYVRPQGLTDTEFTVSTLINGNAVAVNGLGTGTFGYTLFGLTRTIIRENYNYNDLTVFQPGEFISTFPNGRECTVSIASPAEITLNSHGFIAGDVVKFNTTGTLPTGITVNNNFHVISAGLGLNVFRVSLIPGGAAVDTTGFQFGTQTVGKVTGAAGDSIFAIIPVAQQERARISGSRFVFLGREYLITEYQSEAVTGRSFARIVLDRPLVNSIIAYQNSYTVKSAVAIRTNGASGSLTIRISLTRVTSHDLLEIGTGSYADTNYPNEIYGPPVNPINPSQETEERDVGRVFYVTTDQFGNFSVGPFFRVDQGTGTVTFSASIALSNLDGLGFKRGVPVSEFSTDSGFTDNATDSVPTENAARGYIERRLGLTHDGSIVTAGQLIPTVTGGYMALDGQLGMKGIMNLNNNKITNLTNATNPQDAVNLRSLTINNLQDWQGSNVQGGQVIAFTGSGNTIINAGITGDLTFELRPGVDSSLNNIDVQINSGVVGNTEINVNAAISQSKLAMTIADDFAAAPSGSAAVIQARSGLASFNDADFTVTDGWVSIRTNSIVLGDLAQIATKTVLGNSALGTANVNTVAFNTVVDDGGAIKKTQYSSTGFLRRTSSGSFTADADYGMIEAAAGTALSPEGGRLIIRDSNGDFGARVADLSQIKLDNNLSIDTATTATGGFIRYYGWDTAGGILVSNGSLAADRVTAYWNNSHDFRTQNGVSSAPITAASIQVTAITTGGNTTAGTITGRWSLTGTSPNESRLQATYSADLAEYYEGDKEYEVGTVLVFGGDKEVTTTNQQGDKRVAGVVSNTAAFAMYEACPGLKNLVALQGRVPCRVVGKIRKGDMLITASIPGVAIAAGEDTKVGTVVGKALVDYDSDHIGTIEIAVGRT